jgi:hypothetical protein
LNKAIGILSSASNPTGVAKAYTQIYGTYPPEATRTSAKIRPAKSANTRKATPQIASQLHHESRYNVRTSFPELNLSKDKHANRTSNREPSNDKELNPDHSSETLVPEVLVLEVDDDDEEEEEEARERKTAAKVRQPDPPMYESQSI